AVAEFHCPADGEQREYEAAEAIGAVIEALARGLFGRNAKNYGGEKRKQNGGFEMGKIHSRHLISLFCGDFEGVYHGQNIQESSRNQKFRAVIVDVAGHIRLGISENSS